MQTYPAWLNQNEKLHRQIIDNLAAYRTTVVDFREPTVTAKDFFPSLHSIPLNISRFVATKDSLFYSKLLKETFDRLDDSSTLVDLGTGSGVPLISALLQSKAEAVALGIDIDAEALKIARENLKLFEFEDRVQLKCQSMLDFLTDSKNFNDVNKADQNTGPKVAIAANPPYLPCPGVPTEESTPVHGGEDGTLYLEKILTHSYPEKTLVAVQWGSVTNPGKVFDLIHDRYGIQFLQAWELPFGKYSLSPAINAHLHQQRSLGKAVFNGESGASQSQLVFGAILAAKKKSPA
jgi:methylase of polypeptide subunit release factors